MRAPFRGVVAAADLEAGEVAAPGQPLVRLVNIDTVKSPSQYQTATSSGLNRASQQPSI